MGAPIAARFLLAPTVPGLPAATANVPSGYSSILLQIRVSHSGAHPLGLSIGVHPWRQAGSDSSGQEGK